MELKDLKLDKIIMELRYDYDYSLWDNAGKLISEIVRKFPLAIVKEAQPNKITLWLEKTSYEFSIELNRLVFVSESTELSSKDFADISNQLFNTTMAILNVNEFQRVGLRNLFSKKYESFDLASQAVLRSGLINLPDQQIFKNEEKPLGAEVNIKWAGSIYGSSATLKAESLNLEIMPPSEFLDESVVGIKKQINRLIYDVDLYSMTKIKKEQFLISDWIMSVIHMLNRDSKVLIGKI